MFVRYGFDRTVCSFVVTLVGLFVVMALVGLFVRYGFDRIVGSFWL